jgi:hypothetical protein
MAAGGGGEREPLLKAAWSPGGNEPKQKRALDVTAADLRGNARADPALLAATIAATALARAGRGANGVGRDMAGGRWFTGRLILLPLLITRRGRGRRYRRREVCHGQGQDSIKVVPTHNMRYRYLLCSHAWGRIAHTPTRSNRTEDPHNPNNRAGSTKGEGRFTSLCWGLRSPRRMRNARCGRAS